VSIGRIIRIAIVCGIFAAVCTAATTTQSQVRPNPRDGDQEFSQQPTMSPSCCCIFRERCLT